MKRKIPALLLLLLSAAAAGAQEPLALEQVRSAALARSVTLRKALLSVDSALLSEKIQGYARLPSLSLGAGARASYPAAGLADSLGASVSLSISQTLYAGGANALLSAIEGLATRGAREQARAEYLGVVRAADEAYYGLLEAQGALEAARSDLEAAQMHLALARGRMEAGMITRFAYLEVEAREAAGQTAVAQAQGRLSVAEGRLASLSGLDPPFALADADAGELGRLVERLAGLDTQGTEALIAEAARAAAAHNPSLAKGRLAREQAALSVELARADYLPRLSASYRHALSGRIGQELEAGSGSLSLSASIPLDAWKTRAGVELSRTAAQQAELEAQELSRNLELDIRAAVYDCLSVARSAVSAAKALQYAEGYYQSVVELYRLGSASSAELSDARALVSANRTALIGARYGLLVGLSALRALSGLDGEEDLLHRIP